MKAIIGVVLVLCGVAFGIWAGLWWAFIGGIVGIIEAVQATPIDAMGIAIGIAKVVFAAAIGWISALLLIVPGVSMLKGRF